MTNQTNQTSHVDQAGPMDRVGGGRAGGAVVVGTAQDRAPQVAQDPVGRTALPTLLSAQRLAHVEAVYRELVTVTFPFETRLGHFLAYLRPYAAPSIAGLLGHTGHVEHAPRKRAVDTGLLIYELFHAGLDSAKGEQVVRLMNGMHQHWRISNEDYVWTLGTFCVLGTQVIDRYAWRRLSEEERQASVDWWRELGTRMGVVDIPATYAEFEDAFRGYEEHRLRRTPTGQALLAASWPVVLSSLPAPVRPLARQITAVLTDEPARAALGFSRPNPAVRAAVGAALMGRSVLQRGRVPASVGFVPGAPVEPYVDGYDIEDLGVGEQHEHPAARARRAGRGGGDPLA